ncbi:HNH endonuclease [Shewanella sp. MM_2022_3]|uniref:HNH endonuclease n=1 Tax=Shewanella sp. MM_2022_3 TaxID=2923280 RepID=UPI001F4C2DCB|nr:HNH endonuclease [Shewanella sp. MM_2022_3]MCH7421472.1 HNH endonuclease [Shewanella sp. MM_2022_3]
MKVCNKAGCIQAHSNDNGYCNSHQKYYQEQVATRNKRYNDNRPPRHSFYFTNTWKRLRDQWIRENPLCCRCEALGIVKLATIVDHIIEIQDNPDLKDDYLNLQSLCHACHNTKTGEAARERKKKESLKGIGRDINQGW